jgi:DNA-binding LytR/AlgR family response regulator
MESETAGFDVVRAASKQQYAPVIFVLTGYPALTSKWEKECAHAGLVKPMDHDNLGRQIDALLRQDKLRKSSGKRSSASIREDSIKARAS